MGGELILFNFALRSILPLEFSGQDINIYFMGSFIWASHIRKHAFPSWNTAKVNVYLLYCECHNLFFSDLCNSDHFEMLVLFFLSLNLFCFSDGFLCTWWFPSKLTSNYATVWMRGMVVTRVVVFQNEKREKSLSVCPLSFLKQENISTFSVAWNFADVHFWVFNWMHCQWHELLLRETKNTWIINRKGVY